MIEGISPNLMMNGIVPKPTPTGGQDQEECVILSMSNLYECLDSITDNLKGKKDNWCP